MKYLLDTDHTSILRIQKGTEYSVLSLNLNLHSSDGIAISIISFHEHILGAHNRIVSSRKAEVILHGYELLQDIILIYRHFPIVPFERIAIQKFEKLKAMKIRISTMDLRIAAIALANNLTLVTRNTRDFELVEGLRLENWTK